MRKQEKDTGPALMSGDSVGVTRRDQGLTRLGMSSLSESPPNSYLSRTTELRNTADAFQQMLFVQSSSDTVHESPTNPLLGLSHSEQQKCQKLLDLGVPVEQLLVILKNRLKQLDKPADVTCHNSIKPGQHSVTSLQEISYLICQQAAENCAQNDIHQAVLDIPPRPIRRRRASTNKKHPAAPRNRSPEYELQTWFNKLPPLIQKLVITLLEKGLPKETWDHLHAQRKVTSKRLGIPTDRKNAIVAILSCLFATMNLTTLECRTWARDIAEKCGLTPAQVSRALDDLAQAGLITKKLNRDSQGHFLPLQIAVTPTLLETCGVSRQRLTEVQKQHQRYSKPENQKSVTLGKGVSSATKKAVSAVAESLAQFKQSLKPKTASFHDFKSRYTAAIVKLVEETLKTFGLGCHSSSFSTV